MWDIKTGNCLKTILYSINNGCVDLISNDNIIIINIDSFTIYNIDSDKYQTFNRKIKCYCMLKDGRIIIITKNNEVIIYSDEFLEISLGFTEYDTNWIKSISCDHFIISGKMVAKSISVFNINSNKINHKFHIDFCKIIKINCYLKYIQILSNNRVFFIIDSLTKSGNKYLYHIIIIDYNGSILKQIEI